MAKKVSFFTLGCRLNIAESNSLKSKFFSSYYKIVPFDEDADVYIINTCSVTSSAGAKSMRAINRAKSRGDNKIVVVTGCFENEIKKIQQDGIILIPNEKKDMLFEIVDGILNEKNTDYITSESGGFSYQVPDMSSHTKAFIKIQDGCDNGCSFCKIPVYRGKARSKDFNESILDVKTALSMGYKEIVLTGINLGRYSIDNKKLYDLVKSILNTNSDFNLSISSLEPYGITDEFLSLYQDPRLKKHMHLCLQSGSDKILMKMRREYSSLDYKKIALKLKKIDPLFNLTTDIIVGFPSEEKEDFKKSLDIISELEISHVHVFPYSDRDGTRSSRMENLIDPEEKKSRLQELLKLSLELKSSFRKKFIGSYSRILVEKVEENERGKTAFGYNMHYIPVKFNLPLSETKNARNHFFNVMHLNLDKDLSLNSNLINEKKYILL